MPIDKSGVISAALGVEVRHERQHAHDSLARRPSNTGAVSEKHADTGCGVSVNTTGSALQYTGYRIDAEASVYYYCARYDSPTIERFLQTDPIGCL